MPATTVPPSNSTPPVDAKTARYLAFALNSIAHATTTWNHAKWQTLLARLAAKHLLASMTLSDVVHAIAETEAEERAARH
ncbi:hypothetical protein [Stenotrophomonas sp. MMGLT7]|uniref:hypothetical protein n=1 Tax=Stenotrophomonas sp. MMGLT7 TaxID=2901227 RepID=UPI001E5FF7D9|nr:hypothetical protein [Stenotrophomonas sp. MMGLT7]MCD7096961.1 hypothetical protein [Stenotrophomonas sp. MMGLT7]